MTATAPEQPHAAAVAVGATPPTRLRRGCAEGIELMGEYEGSGLQGGAVHRPPRRRRRRSSSRGCCTSSPRPRTGDAALRRDGRAASPSASAAGVSADNVRFLVERKLRPLGVLAAADGTSPELERPDPLLALKFRTALVPDGVTRALTTIFRPLFLPPVVVAVVARVPAPRSAGCSSSTASGRACAGSSTTRRYLLVLFGGIVVGTAFHEIGHATALRYGGGRPGVMGAGHLRRLARVLHRRHRRVPARQAPRGCAPISAGIYFNMIVAIVAVAMLPAHGLGGHPPARGRADVRDHPAAAAASCASTATTSSPTSPASRTCSTGSSRCCAASCPARRPTTKVTELKPWARRVVTSYVLLLVPVLALMFVVDARPRARARSPPPTTPSSSSSTGSARRSTTAASSRSPAAACSCVMLVAARCSASCSPRAGSAGAASAAPGAATRERPRRPRRARRRRGRRACARRVRLVAQRRLPADPAAESAARSSARVSQPRRRSRRAARP